MFSLTVNGTPCSGPLRRRRVRGVGRRPRLVGEHDHDRVQVAVDGLDALEVRVDDLARGHLAARDQLGQLSGAAAPQLLGHALPSCSGMPPRPYTAGIARVAARPESFSDQIRAPLVLAALAVTRRASAAPEIRTAAGASPAALDATVDAFRADAGAARREINWDGAPASAACPGRLLRRPRRGVRHARHRHRGLDPARRGAAGSSPTRAEKLFAPVGSNYTNVRFNVPGHAARGVHGRVRRRALRRRHGRRRGVTFLDSRGGRSSRCRSPPARTGSPSSACASATASAWPRSRSAPAPSRSRPASSTAPQTDLAAIDDVIFGEPQADLAPPPEPELLPTESGLRVGARAVAARVADPAGPKSAPGAR